MDSFSVYKGGFSSEAAKSALEFVQFAETMPDYTGRFRNDSGDEVVEVINKRVLAAAVRDAENALFCPMPSLVVNALKRGAERNRARMDAYFASDIGRAVKATVTAHLGSRMDAVGGGVYGGWALPYQLIAIRGQVLEQPMPPLNAEKCFPVNGEAAYGMMGFATRRTNGGIMAKWIGSNAADTPGASTNVTEVISNIRMAHAGYKLSLVDLASADAANFQLQQREVRNALRALENLANYTVWNGDEGQQIWGVINGHPVMPTDTLPTFSSSASSATMNDLLLASFDVILNNSFNAFGPPDSVAISSKLMTFCQRTYITVGGTTVTKTLWQSFVDHAKEFGVKEEDIHVAQELLDCGPNGEQGMFLYNRRSDGGVNAQIIKPGGPVAMPVQFVNLETKQDFVQAIGGFRSENPASCNMVFVPVA